RIEGGLAGVLSGLHGGESGGRFFRDGRFLGGGQSPPGGPADAHHLVQDAVAFGGERDGCKFGRSLRAGMVRGGHESLFRRWAPECKLLLYADKDSTSRCKRCARNREGSLRYNDAI